MKLFSILALCVTVLLSSCAFSPSIDAEGHVVERKSSQLLLKYGERAFEQFKEDQAIETDPQYTEPVKRVAKRLKKAINMPDADWEFVVFKDRTPNAFALPGGKVGVNTGLFSLIKDKDSERRDALLAAVLGHEISHSTVKHAERRMYRAIASAFVASALWYGLERNGEDHPEQAVVTFALANYLLDSLPLSRWQEYESDKIGAVYMAKAGYDPRESIELWKRLEYYHSLGGTRKPAFLRTHPSDSRRIEELEKFMPVALKWFVKQP